MNDVVRIILMTIGAIFASCGLILAFTRKTAEINKLKIFGQELELSSPSLVVFLAGCGLLIGPFLIPGNGPTPTPSSGPMRAPAVADGAPGAKAVAPDRHIEVEQFPAPPSLPKTKDARGIDTRAGDGDISTKVIDGIDKGNYAFETAMPFALGRTYRGRLNYDHPANYYALTIPANVHDVEVNLENESDTLAVSIGYYDAGGNPVDSRSSNIPGANITAALPVRFGRGYIKVERSPDVGPDQTYRLSIYPK